jgi:acetamidase/formamidase
MPPAENGQHKTQPPRLTGGNIDCKELVAGTILYLPIAVTGGLFSTGDGHAAQGDGEVSNTAIECPIEDVQLTFHLHPDMHIPTPRAWTENGWLTFGFDENLNVATHMALEAMLDLMTEQDGLSRPDALALASVVVDLRITQIANKVLGVHAVLAHNAWQ